MMRFEYGVPFWSYSDTDPIPERTLIEHVLLYGQPEAMSAVVRACGYEQCHRVFTRWIEPLEDRLPSTVSFIRLFLDVVKPS